MKDYLIRGIDETGNIRIFVASTTNLVEEARIKHNTSATATAALGRSLTATAIMASMMKNKEDTISLKIQGDGPLGRIITTGNTYGEVKGYVDNPNYDTEAREDDGKLDVGKAVGRNGMLTVTMDQGLKDPYIGSSNLVTGEIAEDIASYYAISEQQPSAVSLGVLVDKDLSVKAAGGFIIQLLPGVAEEDIVLIEEALSKIKPISTYIDNGLTPEEIMGEVLKDFNMRVIGKEYIKFECDCSRERVIKAISSLANEEIQEIIDEDGGAEIVCHFCNEKHKLSKEDLEKIIVDKF